MLAQDPEPLRAKVVSCAGDYDAYAIVFDAVLHGTPLGDTNGIIVEVGVKGEDTAWRFAQPYRAVTEKGEFERLGDVVVLESVENLLR
jgi:hypothetical protein